MSAVDPKKINLESHVVVLNPTSKVIRRVIVILSKDRNIAVHETSSINQINEWIPQIAPCLVLIHINTKENLVDVMNFLKLHRNLLRSQALKTIVLSQFSSRKEIAESFQKLGCTEFSTDEIPDRSLYFKVTLQLKALASRRQQYKQELELAKKQNILISATSVHVNVKESNVLQIAEDVWLFKGQPPQKVGSQWLMHMHGPDPTSGEWTLASDDGTNQKWMWNKKSALGHLNEQSNGWVYEGKKPVFQSGQWKFVGETPNLSFIEGGAKVATKLSTNPDNTLSVAKDSPQAANNIAKSKELALTIQKVKENAKKYDSEDPSKNSIDDLLGTPTQNINTEGSVKNWNENIDDEHSMKNVDQNQSDQAEMNQHHEDLSDILGSSKTEHIGKGSHLRSDQSKNLRPNPLLNKKNSKASLEDAAVNTKSSSNSLKQNSNDPSEISDDENADLPDYNNHESVDIPDFMRGHAKQRVEIKKKLQVLKNNQTEDAEENSSETEEENLERLNNWSNKQGKNTSGKDSSEEDYDESSDQGLDDGSDPQNQLNQMLNQSLRKGRVGKNPLEEGMIEGSDMQGEGEDRGLDRINHSRLKANQKKLTKLEQLTKRLNKLQNDIKPKTPEQIKQEQESHAALLEEKKKQRTWQAKNNAKIMQMPAKVKKKDGTAPDLLGIPSYKFGTSMGSWVVVPNYGHVFITPEMRISNPSDIVKMSPFWFNEQVSGDSPYFDESRGLWFFDEQYPPIKAVGFFELPDEVQDFLIMLVSTELTQDEAEQEASELLTIASERTKQSFDSIEDADELPVAEGEPSLSEFVDARKRRREDKKQLKEELISSGLEDDFLNDEAVTEEKKNRNKRGLAFLLGLSDRLAKRQPREKILKWVIEEIERSLSADTVAICLMDQKNVESITVLAASGKQFQQGQTIPISLSPIIETAVKNKSQQVYSSTDKVNVVEPIQNRLTFSQRNVAGIIYIERRTRNKKLTEQESLHISQIADGIKSMMKNIA